ncbi:unnamed protein product [Clavelina lepadiformis]|uniref:Gypsy retrotransposon integrase-like protein 1 n=1 Tax=Clavelina lepadiformis TaxID=159417 RepID=A0ABP0FZP4_CLALP
MNLITVNADSFIANVIHDDVILGDLGTVSLTVDSSVKPRILPCRRIPVALQEKVKQELDKLVASNVISVIDDPTEWVSQMAIVSKPNGKIRICIDPQPLNVALQREHYKLPTLDDILPALKGAKVFSKLDVKHAFWHVKLDDASSRLTTMITPHGRFRWNRLPFGLKVSSEIFQKRLHSALSGLQGVFAVADDVIVIGCGKTTIEAETHHDQNLTKLRERCHECNILLNEEKTVTKASQITFMGHLISNNGIAPDPAKIEAIQRMPSPEDVSGVKRFCGMVQYLARFLPNLANDLEPLRKLTRKNEKWKWSEECENAMNKVKEKLCETPILTFFDQRKDLILQVDSSKSGLGAVLLQNDQPIEYASRALTKTEQNWAQIEKELLSVVFGLERFDQYTYGRKIIVHNDHRPLQSILKKPLSQAPKRLQALIMRLNRYDIVFEYVPGTALVIADTLSRAYPELLDQPNRIAQVVTEPILDEIPDERLKEIKSAIQKNEESQLLLEVIKNGWPDNKEHLPPIIKPYFSIRDTLSQENDIILKGERTFIPQPLRSEIKSQLHSAHFGADSMLRRARETVFWLGMPNELRQLAHDCTICQQAKPNNQREPLLLHPEGLSPFEKVGVDLFELNQKSYLVTVDYFSNFAEIDVMTSTTAKHVIISLKRHFARYGIPKCIVSDSGPQFISTEFQIFCQKWAIQHYKSSPGHQQCNGKAEAAVKTLKNMLRRTAQDGKDQWLALLELRNTPRQDVNCSPTKILFGRPTRSVIPIHIPKSKHLDINRRHQRRTSVKQTYDSKSQPMSKLYINQRVYFQSAEKKGWQKGKIVRILGPRSYFVESLDGFRYCRNRVHIRVDHSKSNNVYEDTDFNFTFSTPNQNSQPTANNYTVANTRPNRTHRMPVRYNDYVL